MKFPNFSDLDKDQVAVYGKAPTDGALLVIGPPGTGKTVMAFHRAQRLEGLGQSPTVIMYNKVLRRYSEARDGVAPKVPVLTMHSWVARWWRKTGLGRAPSLPDDRWAHDWEEMLDRASSIDDPARLARLDWGHLVIDEGQDFPEAMYFAMGRLMKLLQKKGREPRITVFADDNQRLSADKNSSVKNISRHLGIARDKSRILYLSKNYRNSREIALFSRYFQVARTSGASNLPDREGEKPSVGLFTSETEMFEFLARKIALSPGKQIGVIVHGSSGDVKRTFNKLKSRVSDKFNTQYYTSAGGANLDEQLDFEAVDTITVVHERSAKGLEFDVVFYVGLEKSDIDGSGMMNERMSAYVMSTRARHELLVGLCGVSAEDALPSALAIMPKPTLKICRYDGHGKNKSQVEGILGKVSWHEPPEDSPFWDGEDKCNPATA